MGASCLPRADLLKRDVLASKRSRGNIRYTSRALPISLCQWFADVRYLRGSQFAPTSITDSLGRLSVKNIVLTTLLLCSPA